MNKFFIFSNNFFNTSFIFKRIKLEDLSRLGYPRTFFYKDNYSKSNAKWFDLRKVIDQNPFISLVEQNLNLNGEFQDYYFVLAVSIIFLSS